MKNNNYITYHCKQCNKDFKISTKIAQGYWNYNCPICRKISPLKSFNVTFKGLENTKG